MNTKHIHAICKSACLALALVGSVGITAQEKAKTVVTQDDKGEMTSLQSDLVISGVRPHWTTYAHGRQQGNYKFGNECGIGAIVPWYGKLYVVNYAAHEPHGSEHQLYIIDQDGTMHLFPGSIGGTPAARMIHKESNQLFIGHYAIDDKGHIRTISIKEMPGRISAAARHLTDPKNKIYYYDMEGMLYEVNVHTLKPKLLYKNPLPGWHGKGMYTTQGNVFLANNGERPQESSKLWQVPQKGQVGKDKNGILATYDGDQFKVVTRTQFTDLTTQHGIDAIPNDQSPLWAIGWDKRSLELRVYQEGKWAIYRLPKAANNNDPTHGWFTEWPRIRAISDHEYLCDMHGLFFDIPQNFSNTQTAGIRPVGSHLRYIPDFCGWQGKVILGSDESSVQGNPLTGQPQSNFWMGDRKELNHWGPTNCAGAIWLKDKVKAGTTSVPYLFAGFYNRMIYVINHGDKAINIDLQLDNTGNHTWQTYKTLVIAPHASKSIICNPKQAGEWIRAVANTDATATISLLYADKQYPAETISKKEREKLFKGLAKIGTKKEVLMGKVFDNGKNFNMTYFAAITKNKQIDSLGTFSFDKFKFTFASGLQDSLALHALVTKVHYNKKIQFKAQMGDAKDRYQLWDVDAASVILHTSKGDLRLPKGPEEFNTYRTSRAVREVESERELANIHGTFYELPLKYVGTEPLFDMMRPICSHKLMIDDYNTWNGLLILTGINADAKPSNHIWKEDHKAAIWAGGIDDLWKLGKPVGVGGPWKNTEVKANKLSEPYLMTGYDHKTLTVYTDKDVEVELWLDVAYYVDASVHYKTFKVKAHTLMTYTFPEGFSAHWAMLKTHEDCKITAQFVYQ